MNDYENKYADVILKTGVALYPGQSLNITTGYKNYEFACLIAQRAYLLGAKYVNIDVVSNRLTRIRVENSGLDSLYHVPDFVSHKLYEMCAADWAFVRIDDTEELDELEGCDSERLSILEKKSRESKQVFYDNLLKEKIAWCVVCAPEKGWAEYINGSDSVEELWKVLAPILRVDTPDPEKAWVEHGERLMERRAKLDALKIKKLHFEGEGTDLWITLNSTSIWKGGPHRSVDGRAFVANIPTEEVFTTPDYSRTEGRGKVTRPLKVLETMVEDVWFEFKEGRVVKAGAAKGGDILEKYLVMDEGSCQVGEVALVGCDSPVYTSGKLFGSILYDENAASHIALGSGYPSCLSNSHELRGDSDLKGAGCNVSLVHTDFMIGSESIKVTAFCEGGSEKVIMEKGLFTI